MRDYEPCYSAGGNIGDLVIIPKRTLIVHHPNKLVILVGLIALLAVSPVIVFAQSCATVEASPQGSSIILRGARQYATAAPGTFCALRPGERFRLTIASPGYETRNLRLTIDDNGELDTSGLWAGPTTRSLLVPGWGQMEMGNKTRGTWAFAYGGASAAYLLYAYIEYAEAKDQYETTLAQGAAAVTESEIRAFEELPRIVSRAEAPSGICPRISRMPLRQGRLARKEWTCSTARSL